MKVTIEFDEEQDAILALQANNWYNVVFEFDQYLRGEIKYGNHTSEIYDHYESVRERLRELLDDYGLKIE